MWSSPLFWIVVAVLVFWWLGAYNRLARLRSVVLQKEVALMQEMTACVNMVDELQTKMTDQTTPWQQDSLQLLVRAVASLRTFMQPQTLHALKSEQLQTLANALQALKKCALPISKEDDGLPETSWTLWHVRLTDIAHRAVPMGLQLQNALDQYNQALEQFPASILAKVCGFSALSVDIFSTNETPHATS
jgi:LemA protein